MRYFLDIVFNLSFQHRSWNSYNEQGLKVKTILTGYLAAFKEKLVAKMRIVAILVTKPEFLVAKKKFEKVALVTISVGVTVKI